MPAIPVISEGSTSTVDPAERIEYWEEYNRRNLVGLTCSSYAEEGLSARETNLAVAQLHLADIAGNGHVIERTPQLCRSVPKDSVFVSMVLHGDGFFYHGDGCLNVRPGDAVLYDTGRPYLFGFSRPMRQLLVDIPREVFADRFGAVRLPSPVLLGGTGAERAALRSSLGAALGELAGTRSTGNLAAAQETILGLLGDLLHPRIPDAGPPPNGGLRLRMAKAYIEEHLDDPRLSVRRAAAAIGVSQRHLTRIFEAAGAAPSRYIRDRRLARAHDELRDPSSAQSTIADVAHRWGFASHAHFTRAFRQRYECPPGEVRAGGAH